MEFGRAQDSRRRGAVPGLRLAQRPQARKAHPQAQPAADTSRGGRSRVADATTHSSRPNRLISQVARVMPSAGSLSYHLAGGGSACLCRIIAAVQEADFCMERRECLIWCVLIRVTLLITHPFCVSPCPGRCGPSPLQAEAVSLRTSNLWNLPVAG